MRLADRVTRVAGSATAAFIPLMRRLRAEGRDVINLAIGEPEYPLPTPIAEAVGRALREGRTRYDAVAGVAALRERLAEPFEGLEADGILVTNGAKQALYAIFQAICDPGDRVIVPSPCWVSFGAQVLLAGAEPVFVPCRPDHQLDLAAVRKAAGPRTRAVLVNSPNNPTGAVYPRADIEALAELALEKDLYIVSDEAYRDFLYDGARACCPWEIEPLRDRLFVVRSFSKDAAMTGLRVGYVAAAKEAVAVLVRLQSHLCGNVCTVAQYGALAAAQRNAWRDVWLADLGRLREQALAACRELFACVPPAGAFYLFPDVSRHLTSGRGSADLAMDLLERTGVAMVPGEAFGAPGHLRISYAVAPPRLAEAFERLRKAL